MRLPNTAFTEALAFAELWFEPSLRTQQWATGLLTAVEGLAGIWIADAFNVGPGPALAVLGALVYAAAAALHKWGQTPFRLAGA